MFPEWESFSKLQKDGSQLPVENRRLIGCTWKPLQETIRITRRNHFDFVVRTTLQPPRHSHVTAISNVLRSGDDIHLFAKDFSIKMVQHGMDTIAYVPNPFDTTKMSYILDDYPKFQADKNIRDQVDLVSVKHDSYDRANSKNATKCLLNSLEESLLPLTRNRYLLSDRLDESCS